MTIRALASKIAKREGKKSQARIGDIREILSILADFIWDDAEDDPETLFVLCKLARSRAKKRKK